MRIPRHAPRLALLLTLAFPFGCESSQEPTPPEQDAFYDGTNPFTDPVTNGKDDSAYVNSRAVEVHVTLTGEVEAPGFQMHEAPAEQAQYGFTALRRERGFFLQVLAEDIISTSSQVEWLVDGEWLGDDEARELPSATLRNYRVRGVTAVAFNEEADNIAVGRTYEALVPRKPFSTMRDIGDVCANKFAGISPSQSVYWYLWNPGASCQEKAEGSLTTMTVTVDEVLPRNPSSYPEYDRLWADDLLSVAVFFGQIDHGGPIEEDENWKRANRFGEWLVEADFVEETTDGPHRRFSHTVGERTEAVDVFYPDAFESVADRSNFQTWQDAVSSHEVVIYNGHSVLGDGYAFEHAVYPDNYQIFMVFSCLSYSYYVHPIFEGKGSWESVDVVANAELGRVYEITPMTGALLAGLFQGFEGTGAVSWQDIMSRINHLAPHSRPGVSGAQGNCFSPAGDRCNGAPNPGPDEVVFESSSPVAIPDGDVAGVTSEVEVTEDLLIGSLMVDLEVEHSHVGDLHITLRHDGVEATVWSFEGGSDDEISTSIELHQFDGTSAAGTWTLHLTDYEEIDSGELRRWALRIIPNE
jgi:Proprotein convertase P-domain